MKYIKLSILTGILLAWTCTTLQAQKWVDMWRNPSGHTFYEIQEEFNRYFETHDAGKGSGYKQFKRWEYFMEPRTGDDGKILNPQALTFKNYMNYVQEKGFNSSGQRTQSLGGDWTFFGSQDWTVTPQGYLPGNGRVNVIAFHPTDTNTIYVGAPAGGLWRTTDYGASWSPLTDGIAFWGVSGIAINPGDTDNIFILTGDGDGGSSRSAGVWETTNGGSTWSPTGLLIDYETSSTDGYKLVMDPTNSNVMLAAMTNGLQRTTDAGATWNVVRSGSHRDIEYRPGTPATMYTTSGNTIARSLDGGATWTNVHTISGASRIALTVSPANGNYVYALAGAVPASGQFYGLWRSTDAGTTWTLRANTPNILSSNTSGTGTSNQAWYDLALACSPTDINLLHSGGINTWVSTDGGTNWNIQTYWNRNSVSFQWMHGDVHDLVYHGNTLYEGNDGGISRTYDGGANWVGTSTGLAITEFYRFGGTPQNAARYVAGSQDNGSNLIEAPIPDLVMTHFDGADGMEAAIDPTNQNTLFSCRQNGGMYRSLDGGTSHHYIAPGILGSGPWVTPYILNPGNSNTIVAAYVDVGVSYSQGSPTNSWINLTSGALTSGGTNRCLAIAPSDTNVIYVVRSSAVWKTTNWGTTWTNITSGLPGSTYTYIAVDPTDANRIYVTRSTYTANSKIFRSLDGGSTWTNYSGSGLPNVPANCVVYAPGTDNGVYIGTDAGVYYRDDNLADWVDFSNGLPFARVMEMEINPLANRLRAATYGRSIWESDLYGEDCDDDLVLSGVLSGLQRIEANNTITSTNTIDAGADITFSAGTSITLNPGFNMLAGSEFHAVMEGCTGAKMHAVPITGTYEPPTLAAEELPGLQEMEGFEVANYPNPFRSHTWISYRLPQEAPVSIEVYDLAAHRIAVLVDEKQQSAGVHTVSYDGSDLPAGQYIARFSSGTQVSYHKMIRIH